MPALTQEDFINDFTSEKVSIRLNDEKSGVEVKFADIPLARRENAAIKAAGFRWSGRQQLWYAKQNENSLGYAAGLRTRILNEIEQKGEKTYSAKEFNAEIEKELESALNPKQSYENVKTENVSEIDGELEKLLRQQEELNRKIDGLKQMKAQKISLDKSSFNKENVNSYNYNNLHSSKSAEENYESEKSSGNAAGESENYRKQDEQGNSGNPLAELDNRNEADLGGNSGRGHGGTGHGNDIRQEFQTTELRGNISASPDDSSVSNGHVRQSDEGQDGKGNAGLLHSGVREGRLADGLSELHSGDEPAGHGNGLLKQEAASKAEMRQIREKCREILNKPDSEITEDEKKILALYEGGGGLKEQDATSNETLNAFYTPRNVIKAVWSLADHYAPNAKTVLEPTSGTGRFAESRPQNEFTLREADETSARIAKILHPNANVIQGEFQAQFFDENGIFRLKNYEMPKYDLVIGNPPYGAYTGEWKGKGEGKEHNRYEEYFIEKGLDSLKNESSVLAFVVPSGWIRSGIDGIKHRIAEKGELIDAYRLPNKAFPTTEVGTDIIVMRSWNEITEEERRTRIEAETEKISGDTWFKNHPEKVLGETKKFINRFGNPDFEVVLPDGVSLDDELRKIDEILENDAEKLSDDYEMSEKEFSNFTSNVRYAEEDFLQGKDQKEDEFASNWANEDFERTQRLNEIISEIKKSDFKMEVSVENNLRKVVLTNKNGDEIFSEKETGNSIMPITSNVAVWANDAESENLKNLADEYFNIISEDSVRSGDYVNKVFEKEEKQSKKTLSDISQTAENLASFPEEIADQLERMETNIRNENGWTSANDIVLSNENARKYLEEIKERMTGEARAAKLTDQVFSNLEADNYHTLNDALGILGAYGTYYQQKVLEKLEKRPSHFLLPYDVAKEFVNKTAQSEEKSNELSSHQEITLTQDELSLAESVIPNAEYSTMLEYAASGEESDFYKQKIKNIATAVQNAPKLYETDGQNEHKIVLRYFHPAGSEAYVTEIGANGMAFGFQCLNGDWQNAEWGYLNLNELKNIPMMETDLYVPDGMSVERYLGKEHPDIFPEYAELTKKAEQNIEAPKEYESSRPLGKIRLVSEEEQLKKYGITTDTHATYFVKSTAEFDQFADFKPITNLTGEEAVAKYKELQEKGVHCGIGINIEGDRVFDDKDGSGITVLVRNNEGRDTLNIYGDSFVKNLKESDQHSFDVLVAFNSLYRTAKSAGLDVENASYIAEKENELFGISQNQIYDGYASKLATNFVLEKLKATGIEVVTDKEEFNRILEREQNLQKMAGTLTPEEQKRYFTFNDEETKLFRKQVDEWKSDKSNIAKLITIGKIPPVMKVLGFPDNPIEIQHSTLSKAMRPIPQGYPNEAQGHALTIDDIYSIPAQLADPVMVFKSRTRSDSYVFFTERKDIQNHSILIPMAVNKHKGRIVINEITSMYGKDNETDFVKKNIDEDNLIYVDKKRSTEWERSSHVQFVTQRLSNSNAYNTNILTKERLVNFITADAQEQKPIQKMSLKKSSKYLKPADLEYLRNLGYKNEDFQQIQLAMLVSSLEDKSGKKISIRKAEELLGREALIAGFSRSAFHWSSAQEENGNYVSFDSRIIFKGSKEDREIVEEADKEAAIYVNELTNPVQQSMNSDGTTYGFAYNGKIYLNPDFLTSNVAVHEYTHLWDEYTRHTNSELWQKGMNILKDTKYFNEVKSDPNYADIANDDNLVLSEVHARICGEMAQKVLERIAKEDGEITKDKVVDWNEETANYLSSELGFERYLISEDIKEFFSTPMTDLMNEKNIFVQKETAVESVQINSVLEKEPPQKERAEIKNKKPFIEESFERLNKTEPKNPLIDVNVLNKAFFGDENMPVQEVRLPQITDRDFRSMKGGNFPWGFRQVFDVETKSAVLVGETKSSANGKVFDAINIVAEMDADGNFRPHFDRLSDDYKKLTDAKKNNLDDLLLEFQENAKNFKDKFIGEKDGKFYFKDAGTNLSYSYRYNSTFLRVNENGTKQIEFDTDNFRFSALTEDKEENSAYLKNCYEKKSDDKYNWYYGKPFYASFDSLYSENGADFNQALEDDSLVHASVDSKIDELQNELENLGWSNGDYKRRDEIISEIVNLPLQESLKMSGLTKDECIKKIKDFNERKAKGEKDRKENDERVLLTEQDVNPKLQKILDSGFELGKEIPLSDSNFEVALCSENSKDRNQTNVFINEEAAFAVNNSTFTVTAFNNFPLTKGFLSQMREKWNGKLNIASSELHIEKPSLDKILEKKQASEKQKNFAVSLSSFVLSKENYAEKDGKVSKSAEIEGSVVKAVKSGTKTKVFFDKSRFSALEYNSKTDILLLNQDVYDKGITFPLEKSLREKNPNLSVTKDFVIENRHYIDTNGKTIIAPPKSARFNPEKEATMDNEEFVRVYGKNWNKDERVFWEATDYKGYVNLSKLSEAEKESLLKDENYVTEQNGKIIHKELFASGNIYRKLEQNEEFLNEGKIDNGSYERNRKILEEAKPKPIQVENISVSVISPFVENYKIGGVPLKDKFLIWATGSDVEDSPNSIGEITDFSVAEISRDDIPPTISWSDVKSYVYGEDLEKVKGIDDDEKRTQIRNQKRNDRKETAEKLFARFIHQGLTKEEQNDFAEKYNRTFNHEKSPDYSKLPLFVDGMNQWRKGKEFKLYEQQIKGISFLCNKGNGLLAYDVGLGKTACGIVATVEQIQSGRASRPIIVVPKSVIGKWEDDIHELFPDIPVNNLGNFSREQVGAFYDGNHGLNIPAGSITLVTKDALNNICFGKKVIDDYLFKDYADLLSLNDDLHDQNPNVRAKAREKIYEKAGVAEQVRSMYYIQWDKTGFDHITVDEAHAYKNLFKVPRPKKGETSEYSEMGSGEPSKRALKMFNMTQIIQQQNENRNVFMLTATPFTNSALEVYSMLSYIARKELEENGIKDLNDFCKQYAMTRYEKAVTKGGKDIKYKNVMKSFNDLPGLQNILKQYIDKVDGAEQEKSSIDFRHSFVRPKKETHTVFLDTTDLQEKIFDFAVHVMDYTPSEKDIAKRQKNGKKGFAPTLEAMNLMRTACLSPALVDSNKLNELLSMVDKKGDFGPIEIPPLKDVVECSPKLKMVCDTVISNWKAHKDCGQVVYMPEGTEAYPHIINYMEKNGVPREVFATIDGSSCKIAGKNVTAKMIGESTEGIEDDEDIASDKRAFVAEKFNDKKNPCKILIGSSAISEGMDLNGNSIALYNCMLGWNPTEDVQVEGRIWRQGNEQGKVHIVYPLVYDSIDSLLYQKHSEKQSRINALFDYKDSSTLNVEDINPEELKYELIKDPVIRAKLEIGDKQIELKKEIVLLENQLKDYDQLVESRMKYKERLAEKEMAKNSYIQNYRESVAKGNAKRTAEEQEEGIARFDKSISDCKKQIENVRRKFAGMEIFTDEDEHNFAAKIIQKKELIQKDIDSLFAPEYQKKVVEKYQKILFEEKFQRTQKEAEEPLDKTIQSDMKPMHVVEHEKKLEKYQRFMKIAEEEGDKKMVQILNENWKEYEDFYQKKYGGKNTDILKNQENPYLKPVLKTEVVPVKVQENQDSIIKVLHHEIEKIDLEKTKYDSSSGLLFDFPEENQDVKKIARRVQHSQSIITAENFAENLEKSLKGIELQKENVLKAANHLIQKMTNEEKMKFVKLSVQLGVNNAEKTNEFFTKMAKGELKLVPNKKPPVIHKKTAVEAEVSM